MAASQARLLQLAARMSNCEYEGQQINQQRTILANESANLFNQMLVMQVPTVPSSSDFTTVQYTFSNGTNTLTLDDYYQLGTPDAEYNYVVTHSHTVKRYTGSMKKLSDPQVQFTSDLSVMTPETYASYQQAIYVSYAKYMDEMEVYNQKIGEANKLLDDVDLTQMRLNNQVKRTGITEVTYDAVTDSFSIKVDHDNDPKTAGVAPSYTTYDHDSDPATPEVPTGLVPVEPTGEDSDPLSVIIKSGALRSGADEEYFKYTETDGSVKYVSKTDLEKFNKGGALEISAYTINLNPDPAVLEDPSHPDYPTMNALKVYNDTYNNYQIKLQEAETYKNNQVAAAENEYLTLLETYNNSTRPSYIGNCELVEIPVGGMTEDQFAELDQVIYDLAKEEIPSYLPNCFDANGDYKGGIFAFTMYGETYYTTYTDLYNSYSSIDHSEDSNNGIDRQTTMPYYSATYVDTKVSKTEKALLETDSTGRFVSIRLENDTVKYTLNAETITDEDAYTDAMNQYYYQTAQYQKAVADVNAKTSIIQQEDRTLELRLKQLDTERNTLSTEMEAVQKVLGENIERTYKTFNS